MKTDTDDLIEFLTTVCHRGTNVVPQIVLMGHSTGCQDIVILLTRPEMKLFDVFGLILQGAVSDREAFDAAVDVNLSLKELRDEMATIAVHMQPNEFLPRRASLLLGRDGDPITAARFLTLNGKQSEEDLFSSDLSVEYLKKRLGHVNCPVLLLLSGADEYYPVGVQASIAGANIAQGFSGVVRVEVVKEANHFLEGKADLMCKVVAEFVNKFLFVYCVQT
jgi:pimeloyl-ACP methyl ester carboxylesterase